MAKKARDLPVAKRDVSEPRRVAFLEVLAKTGIVAEASRLASPHAANVKGASGAFYSLRRRDPHFAAAWDAAQEQADAALLMEARRRAVHGSKKGIFQKGVRVQDVDPETGEQVAGSTYQQIGKNKKPLLPPSTSALTAKWPLETFAHLGRFRSDTAVSRQHVAAQSPQNCGLSRLSL